MTAQSDRSPHSPSGSAYSETYGATPEHLASVDEVILAFARWQDAHEAIVKVPD